MIQRYTNVYNTICQKSSKIHYDRRGTKHKISGTKNIVKTKASKTTKEADSNKFDDETDPTLKQRYH